MAISILYGNGLNRLSNAPSWDNIMKMLESSWASKNISSCNVPNTIQFDELVLQSQRKNDAILRHLCQILDSNWENKVYQVLANKIDTNFITTNYDFTLEYAIKKVTTRPMRASNINERFYNVNTYYAPANNAKVWHIHGDVSRPQSIILGYDHYCKQITKIAKNIPLQSLSGKVALYNYDSKKKLHETWATDFFTNDVYIIGCGLGFVELDLWWLLDMRAYTMKLSGKKTNRIVYLDTDIENRKMDKQEHIYRENFKTVLTDYDIVYKLYTGNNREEAYLKAIKNIP